MTKYIDRYYLNGEVYGIKFAGGGGGGRQPGANTLAYYPLDTDFSDQSGNGYDLTENSGGSITTFDGVSCAYFTLNGKANNSLISLGTTRTVSFWFNPHQSDSNGVLVWTGGNGSVNTTVLTTCVGNNNSLDVSNYYNLGIQSNTTILDDTRNHGCVVATGGNVEVYLNGVNVKSSTSFPLLSGDGITLGYRGDAIGNSKYEGGLSNVIIEDKARTAQEISDYYNQTKDNYQSSTPEPQTESCHVCGGTGEEECNICGGTGQEMCPTCSGMGQIGDPEDPESRTSCPDCDGAGFISCGNCEGTGMMTCSNCGGTGEEPLP